MNAVFGTSKLESVIAFMYVLSLQLLRSAHPDWYANVTSPFILRPLSTEGGGLTSYDGYLEMTVSPSDGKSIRDILGETPTVVMRNLEGAVEARFMGWTDNNRLHVAFVPAEHGTCVGQIESILDSNGNVRWTNSEV